MTPEQQPNTPPQPPQGRPAPQPGMAQPPLPQQPNAPQPWPAQQPPAAQPWPPQQSPQAWGAPQQPPAGPQDRQGVLERHHVHHSSIGLGSIQTAVMLLVVVLFSMGSAIVGAISEGDTITSSDGPVLAIVGLCVAGGLVLVVGLVALYQWVSYKHLYYELGPEEFNLYSGIFNKKRVHVPYQRIQSVDQRASLLQRVFGVCTVSIDTAGGASNKAVTVPFVQKSQAEALRRELFSRKQYQLSVQNGADPAVAAAAAAAAAGMAVPGFAPQAGGMPGAPDSMPGAPIPGGSAVPGAYPAHQSPGNVLDAPAELWNDVRGVFGGMHVDTGRVTYEYGMSNKELVLTGISNNTAFLLIAIGIIGAVAQVAGEVVPLLFGSFEPVVGNVVEAGSRLFGGNLIAVGVVAFLAVAAVMWVLSAIGTCISYGGFRACRRDNRIEVEHGLLQHRFQGVDVDRVQSVVVKQSFIRRLMGYCELSLGKIDAAAENSNEQNNGLNTRGLVIHPFVKLDRVPEILAGIIPEFADVPVDNKPVARVGLRRALIRRCLIQGTGFWLAVTVAIVQIVLNMVLDANVPEDMAVLYFANMAAAVGYALCFVLLVLDAIGAVLWFRGSGFSYNERFMQVSNGGFARETISFPRKKIQFGFTKTNPFQRRAHTATVNARTAAGIGGTTVRLIDVCEEDASAWLGWLKPHGNVVQ